MRTFHRSFAYLLIVALLLSFFPTDGVLAADYSWAPGYDPSTTIKAVLKYRHLFYPGKPGWDAILGPCMVGEPGCPTGVFYPSGGVHVDLNPMPYAQVNRLTLVYDGISQFTASLLPSGSTTPIVMTYLASAPPGRLDYLQLSLDGQVAPGPLNETVSFLNARLNGNVLADAIGTTDFVDWYLRGVDLAGGFTLEGDLVLTWPQSNTGSDEGTRLILRVGATPPSGLILAGQVNHANGQPLPGVQIFRRVNGDPALLAATSGGNGAYQADVYYMPGGSTVRVWAQSNGYRLVPDAYSWIHPEILETRTLNFTGIPIPAQAGNPDPNILNIAGIPSFSMFAQATVTRFPASPIGGVPGAVINPTIGSPEIVMNNLLSGNLDGAFSSQPCVPGVDDALTPYTCSQLSAVAVAQENPPGSTIYFYSLLPAIHPKPLVQGSYAPWLAGVDAQGLAQGLGYSNLYPAAPAADVNLDGIVDTNDVIVIGLQENWTTASPVSGWKRADVNYDGVVDTADVIVIGLVTNWLHTW